MRSGIQGVLVCALLVGGSGCLATPNSQAADLYDTAVQHTVAGPPRIWSATNWSILPTYCA